MQKKTILGQKTSFTSGCTYTVNLAIILEEMEIIHSQENEAQSSIRKQISETQTSSFYMIEDANLLESIENLEEIEDTTSGLCESIGSVLTVIFILVFLSYILVKIITLLLIKTLAIL